MGSYLDTLWERVKARWPRLADFDVIRDQSQTHHTLNTGLLFGTVGCAFAALPQTTWAMGWSAGVLGGLVGYVIRERWPFVWLSKDYDIVHRWDGTLDVLVPMCRLLPLALCVVMVDLPAWVVIAQQVFLAGEALGYTVFRPARSLFY